MRILLINPWIYDFAAYDEWMKPLGLLYIGAFLEKFGYHIFLINCMDRHHPLLKKKFGKRASTNRKYDCGKFFEEAIKKPKPLKNVPRKYKRYGITPDIFEEELRKIEPPDIIGVSSGMTYWYPGAFEVIRRVKLLFPGVPVVLGGIYATLCSQHARKFSGADYVIEGRGEIKILKIVDELAGVKRDYSLISNELGKLPYPAYYLMKRVYSVSMITSLGCPFRCSYCASKILQPVFYQRSPGNVIEEIDYYTQRFGVKDIAFYDDALLVNPEGHIFPILDLIIRRVKDVRFHTPNGLHIRYINQKLAKKLFQANFKTIRLSFETSNPKRWKDSCYKVSNQDLMRTVDNLKMVGYRDKDIQVYVMVGLPGQSFKEIMDTVKFVHKLKVKINPVEFSPIPGTEEYKKAVRDYGFPSDEPLFQNNSIFPMQTKDMDYSKFWEMKNYITKLNSDLK
ncbi:radical SAM protein [Candidatus Aerophobetes bacterium]|nr:radical SAM protein [Candidatus Aerophobetes bacterium]